MHRPRWSGHVAILPALQSFALGGLRMRVRGASMTPLLRDGAIVELAAAGFIWPGDVVAFLARDGAPVVHRAIGWSLRRSHLALIAQGDACARPDAAIDREQIIGRVVRIDGVAVAEVPLGLRIAAARRFVEHLARSVLRRLRGLAA